MEVNLPKTHFERLKVGSLFRGIRKENSEPENTAIGQVSKELRFLQRHHQYILEIERVLKELRLTALLIKESRNNAITTGVAPQELLVYHQGVFFGLVHQMKDKILQLIHLMTEGVIPEKPTQENDVTLADLLKNKEKLIGTIGIKDLLTQWDQQSQTSKIAVVLRKRTHHHHRVSGLGYDEDFLNLKFVEMVSDPKFQFTLSDYGKERIEKIRKESTDRLFTGAYEKAQNTLQTIESNIEDISEALVRHLGFPLTQEELAKIIDNQIAIGKSFDVINQSSLEKVPEDFKRRLDAYITKIHENYGQTIEAVYLVGSLGRGEYEEGYSDINLYVVLKVEDAAVQSVRENDRLSLRVFTHKEFLSEKAKKYRVITKADGVLLYGNDLVAQEKLPKAGLLLAALLNDDIVENLDEAERWMRENPTATPSDISLKSRKLAKRILDFLYGIDICNKPRFTSSRKERVAQLTTLHPENQSMVETLVDVSRYGVGEFESFKNMIDGFRSTAEDNLKRMQEVRTHTEKST